jgi:hypothetical protein
MIGDHHGQTAGRANRLVKAVDGILGTHRSSTQSGSMTHVNPIFAKTGSRDRVQAMRYAYTHGYAAPALSE